MKIDRTELIGLHNPVLTGIKTDSPLTVGNGELAFTADITGMQTLYEEYRTVPLCTMSQWGWHTEPVSERTYAYTLNDLVMTEYDCCGRRVKYPQKKQPGNEAVYDWLRKNPHRLNLARIGFFSTEKVISAPMISQVCQELDLYEGILDSRFSLEGVPCHVITACDHAGNDVLAFRITGKALKEKKLGVRMDFPYGSPGITGSDWSHPKRHHTQCVTREDGSLLLTRILDRDRYEILIKTTGKVEMDLPVHCLRILAEGNELEMTVSFGITQEGPGFTVMEVLEHSRQVFQKFWEEGGIIRLNRSPAEEAFELERRIILSQYLMAVNSGGSAPPQETGLTCNSWYGKMHLEMYLWHCAWLPLWHHTDIMERSLAWYKDHLLKARENASRNGYKGARWPKMTALHGVDSPSPVAPLLVWQQPHIIYMLEMAYQQNHSMEFLKRYWILVKETAEFMADFVVLNPETGCYDICAPVIPVQECHKETETKNPAFELEYWYVTLKIAAEWARRLKKEPDEKWEEISSHMARLTIKNGLYMAHENCPETFIRFHKDHPSMIGAFGLIDGGRTEPEVMKRTLEKILECWDYPTLWGWDFAMMAMTAVRLNEPELAVKILLMDTPKNHYLPNGHNMQLTRNDLPLYLPGNGSLLLAAAIMTAGYPGCIRKTPGFPEDGNWVVEYEDIEPFL